MPAVQSNGSACPTGMLGHNAVPHQNGKAAIISSKYHFAAMQTKVLFVGVYVGWRGAAGGAAGWAATMEVILTNIH